MSEERELTLAMVDELIEAVKNTEHDPNRSKPGTCPWCGGKLKYYSTYIAMETYATEECTECPFRLDDHLISSQASEENLREAR